MDDKARGLIEEIKFPEGYKAALSKVVDIGAASVERDGLPIESGMIDLGVLPEELDLPYLVFSWIAETNEVIENLNLVLTDLHILGENYFRFEGSPRVRFYLLIRTFFYEFYRLKEIFIRTVSLLKKNGYMVKEDRNRIVDLFEEAFKPSVKLRGSLVHGSIVWKGKDHFELAVIGGLKDAGLEHQFPKLSGDVCFRKALHRLCEQSIEGMLNEGRAMSKIIQMTVDYWVKQPSEPSAS